MKLDVSKWKEFRFGNLIIDKDIYKAKAINKDELVETTDLSKGIRYITRTGDNNGCEMLALLSEVDSAYVEEKNAITIGDTTATCFYQAEKFIAGDHMVVIRADWLNEMRALYILSIFNNEQYKYSYGRAFLMDRIKDTIIKLPAIKNGNEYIPDWVLMEEYIHSLHCKALTTKNQPQNTLQLQVDEWEEFMVGDIFDVKYGINMELNTCDEVSIDDKDAVAFVARTAENNGVSAFVKAVDGKTQQKAMTITCAGGGSVLSTFVQVHDFYSGRDLYLLNEKEQLSVQTKLFLTTVIEQNKYRFSYGRQANKTLPQLLLKLPIQRDDLGNPIVDVNHKYSEKGYIPDWKYMDDYIKALPYGDRLNN